MLRIVARLVDVPCLPARPAYYQSYTCLCHTVFRRERSLASRGKICQTHRTRLTEVNGFLCHHRERLRRWEPLSLFSCRRSARRTPNPVVLIRIAASHGGGGTNKVNRVG